MKTVASKHKIIQGYKGFLAFQKVQKILKALKDIIGLKIKAVLFTRKLSLHTYAPSPPSQGSSTAERAAHL